MENLAIKISEALGITTQKAIELYPLLRIQFQWYKVFNIFILISFLSIFIILLILSVSSESSYKAIKYRIILLLFFITMLVTSQILSIILAPDIHVIMDLLSQL